jgi:transcriptional regulator with XRE-family HTH domain
MPYLAPILTGGNCTQTAAKHPKTIVEHLKRRRLVLHLMQAEVAQRLGVHKGSIQNWERGLGAPGIRQLPAIVKFLGYDLESEPDTLPKYIGFARRRLGFTQEDLARVLKVNPAMIWSWETGRTEPTKTKLRQIRALIR